MLGFVIRYFNGDFNSDGTLVDSRTAWLCLAGINACQLSACLVDHPMIHHMMRLGMRQRIAACTLMYQKSLKLSRSALDETAVGQIINIMSNDVNRFDEFATASMYYIIAPIQTGIVVYIVWTYLRWTAFIGLVVLLLFIPFQALMGRLFSKVRLRTALLTDSRLRYMNEIISGMRVIKMYCWEKPFADRVANARG